MNPNVMLGFDMETDIGSWTPFYEGLVHGTPKLLEILAKNDAKATFYFVGDAARQHPEIVKMVDAAGHEVGCHTLYHETIGDELFPIPGIKPVLPEECYHRIEVATDMVEQVCGKKMTSFRAPRLWASTAVVNALEDLGYTTDASYPMYFYKDRLAPYHPSRTDWTAEGDMKILEIPNFADMTIESSDEFGRDRDQWPLFRTVGAEAMMVHVNNMLEFYRERGLDAVLCFYMHPWEFWEMPQGAIHFGEGAVIPDSFIVKNCGKEALRQLDHMLLMLRSMDAEFVTARDLASDY
ncbi:MAG: polysaccharide deacetylase family protein [Armatimonadota bacterium]